MAENSIKINIDTEQLDEAKKKADELYDVLQKIHNLAGTPISGMNEIDGDVLIIQLNTISNREKLIKAGKEYTEAIGKQCVCIDSSVKSIKGVCLDALEDGELIFLQKHFNA